MDNEIDRLEIEVEAEANRANRALRGLEKKLTSIATSLEKIHSLTNGSINLGSIASSSKTLNSNPGKMEDLGKSLKPVRRAIGKGRVRADIKYKNNSIDDIYEKYKDVGRNVNVSGKSLSELQRGYLKATKEAERFERQLEKKMSIEGTKNLGKSFEGLVYNIQRARNEAEAFDAEIKRISKQVPDFTIKRDNGTDSVVTDTKAPTTVSKSSLGYDSEAMRMTFGEEAKGIKDWGDAVKSLGGSEGKATQALKEMKASMSDASNVANTYEGQIKRLKAELSNLSSQGFSQHDPEYDRVAQELAEVVEAKRRYDAEMKKSAKASFDTKPIERSTYTLNKEMLKASNNSSVFRRSLDKLHESSKKLNSLSKTFRDIGRSAKSAKGILNGILHPIKTLREAMGGMSKRRGMPLSRMLGTSLLFNTVFRSLSMIQNAIKEGSNNLVQYSSAYNSSISSMASSLLYLKNAWSAAFAPIVNVVGPYISAFIDMLATALNAVGQFMAALTGKGFAVQAKKTFQDYGASLGGVGSSGGKAAKGLGNANKAAKELKRTLMGFDQINKLPEPTDSGSGSGGSGGGGGGAGGGGDVSPYDMFETVNVDKNIADLAKMFKEAWAESDFTEIGAMLGDKLNGALESIKWDKIKETTRKIAKSLATFLNGFIAETDWKLVGGTIAEGINTAFEFLYTFVKTFDWKKLGKALADGICGFFEKWDAGLTSKTFSEFGKGLLEGLTSFIDTLGENDTFEKIGKKVVDFICGIDWLGLAWDLSKFFVSLSNALLDFPTDFAKGFATSLISNLLNIDEKDVENAFKKIDIPGIIARNTIGKLPFVNLPLKASIVFEFARNIIGKIPEWIESGKKKVTLAIEYGKKIIGKIPEWFQSGKKKIAVFLEKKWNDFKSKLKIPDLITIKANLQKKWGEFKKTLNIPNSVTVLTELKKKWSKFKTALGIPDSLSVKMSLSKTWKSLRSALGIPDSFKLKFDLPKIKVNWGEKKMAGFTIKYPTGFSTYAQGGFPAIGEAFIAREKGPELVGRIGRRNAVANNVQIIESVARGVEAAVVRAMSAVNPNSQTPTMEFTFMVDSSTVYKMVKKGERKSNIRYSAVATI